MGLDLKLTDADGVTLPQQRGVVGTSAREGAIAWSIATSRPTSDALDEEGYFDTGDLAMIDDAGNITICGRSKDLIKSGGEWINPAEIEAIVGRHPACRCRRRDRPRRRKVGRAAGADRRAASGADDRSPMRCSNILRGKIADWWLPDEVAQVQAMPLAATGKIDKNQLRADYAEGRIQVEGAASDR